MIDDGLDGLREDIFLGLIQADGVDESFGRITDLGDVYVALTCATTSTSSCSSSRTRREPVAAKLYGQTTPWLAAKWPFVAPRMGLTGACTNQDGLAMITKADELRVRLLDSASGPVAPVPFAVFRAQPIRAMVVEVLAEAATDLRTGEVRARIRATAWRSGELVVRAQRAGRLGGAPGWADRAGRLWQVPLTRKRSA